MQLSDVICRREAGNAIAEGITQEWVWHSPTGFEWSTAAADRRPGVALNILLTASGDPDFSAQHHQAFKWQFVAKPPAEGGKISASEENAWIEERRLAPAGNVNGQDS